MTTIAINSCFGGFSLSDKAVRRLFELKGWKCVEECSISTIFNDNTLFYKDSISDDNFFNECDLERDDAELIKVIKELGEEANGRFSYLKIIMIPDEVDWTLEEHGGKEYIEEKHRTWC